MLKSFFKKFSSGSDEEESIDFSTLKADMHSHLIPGIDDGAKTIEDSLELIRIMHGLGYSKFITTPHIMSDYFRNTPEIILEGLATLKKALVENNIPVEVSAAAEYYLDDGFIRKLEEEKLLTFGDNYLLVEVSYINPPDNVNEVLFRAQVLGYKPVLAHPERYPFWHRDLDHYKRFYEMGVTLQLNLNSLAGYYGPDAKKVAEKLIDMGIIGALGTDMHHLRHAGALQQVTKEKYLKKILDMPLLNREL
jgi:protein-tyrosine phosphatase